MSDTDFLDVRYRGRPPEGGEHAARCLRLVAFEAVATKKRAPLPGSLSEALGKVAEDRPGSVAGAIVLLLQETSDVHDADELEADALEVARFLASAYANPRPRLARERLRRLAAKLRRQTIEGVEDPRLRLLELVKLARSDLSTLPKGRPGHLHRFWAVKLYATIGALYADEHNRPHNVEAMAALLAHFSQDRRLSPAGAVARIAVLCGLPDTAGTDAVKRWTVATDKAARRAGTAHEE